MDLTNLDVSTEEPNAATSIVEEEVEIPSSPLGGPPSETSSSQEWDKVTEASGTTTPA